MKNSFSSKLFVSRTVKLSLIGVFFALTILLLVSCKKDTIYTVKIISGGEGVTVSTLGTFEVTEGGNLVISSTTNLGYERIIKINGSETILTEDFYILQNITSDLIVEVGGKRTQFWALFQNPWKTQMFRSRLLTESEWTTTYLPPNINVFIITFTSYRIIFKNLKGEVVADMEYRLKPGFLVIGYPATGTVEWKIDELTPEKFAYSVVSEFYNGPYDQDHTKDRMAQYSYIPDK